MLRNSDGVTLLVQVCGRLNKKVIGLLRHKKECNNKILEGHTEQIEGVQKPVKYLQCNNAGEHMSELRKICKGEYGIQRSV